jgi:4-amino-4-deoxy-L-arabinose transferase-like glycosyltransferase
VSQLAKLVAILYVFAGSLAVLCWSAGDAGIGTPYVDPVSKIHAEEEGLYGSAVFERAVHRPASVLIWLQAAWAKASGPGVWALRMPSLLAGAGTAAIVFAWLLFEIDDLFAALVGAVLILSSHLFFSLSRIGIPDALLTFWITAVMFIMSRRPRWSGWLAAGAAVPWILYNWPAGWSTPATLLRFILLDPLLVVAALLALVWKRRRVLTIWILVAFAGALLFQHRGVASLLPALPALAILAAGTVPIQRAKWVLGLAVAVFVGKVWAQAQPWGIPWEPEFVNPSHAALARYAALHRGNELFVIEPDDQFDSASLGLPRVSYVYTGNPPAVLRKWGVDAIAAPNDDSLAQLMREHPEADLFVPSFLLLRDQGVHQTFPMRGARAFLLSRKMIHRP